MLLYDLVSNTSIKIFAVLRVRFILNKMLTYSQRQLCEMQHRNDGVDTVDKRVWNTV